MKKLIAWLATGAFALYAAALSTASISTADGFPSKPIKLVVPFSAGGSTDREARLVAGEMEKVLGVPVVVENVAGAGGSLAAQQVIRSAPDGYTLFFASISAAVINPLTNPNVGYDTSNDFEPVALGTRGSFMVAVGPNVPATSSKEFIALLKQSPGAMNYGISGVGGITHMGMLLFQRETGTEMREVAYPGSAQVLQALVSGEVDVGLSSATDWAPQVSAGQIRALFVTGSARHKALPDVKTATEVGLSSMEFGFWYGYMAPKGTPAPVVEKLNGAINTALITLKAKIEESGSTVISGPPSLLAEAVQQDHDRWKSIVDAAGLGKK